MAKPLKILIVEDQFVEANHLRLMLKKAGHSVIGMARSVQDAKYYIEQEKPELVLLDIFLSGKQTGIDLAEILREDNIPFIYLSANSNEEVLSKAKLTHPHGFLVKPFREKDLLVAIEIAEYHQQHGIESSIRKELLFQKKLKTIVTKSGTWDDRVLNIIAALQSLISFDLVMAVFYMENKLSSRVLGYARTGLHEYQRIGIEELQNITGLKQSEITELRNKSKVETEATFYNGPDFIKICDKTPIKKMIASSMNMHSNLMLPVPLSLTEKGGLYLSFFSRQADNYNKNHLTLCERLQEPLIFAIENLISHDKKLDKKNTSAENPGAGKNIKNSGFESIVGKSPALLKIFDHILQVAPADTTVLITGESGTGKESIAHSIKELSNRKNQPFVKINCSALPPSLIESELFGHEKGSFTGASERRIGKFEQADNGTLFLDEIGDMPLEMQAKLLRAIQEKEIERVGGNLSIKINVRIIAATNCNLEKEVADGRFRLDLYYRLNVFPIQATSAGFIVGDKGVLLIETMLSKGLYDQLYKLIRSVTPKPIVYAINTSDHGDHCFGNYLLPKETIVIQNEFCKENLSKNYDNIKQFMIMLFGKGRGIEESVYRPADITIAINQTMKIDMGKGNIVEVINVGTAQSPADLFVYLKSPSGNVLWAGNPFIAESPTIPWLFDGYFLEPVQNLNKIYNMISDKDIVVPGHGRITNKAGIKYTIDYVTALQSNVENAVKKGLTLEETKATVTMKEFNKGYELFNWLHFNFNVPNAYKDIKQNGVK